MSRLVLAGLLLAGSLAASARPGLDLVVLVDRSTSMARKPRQDVLLLTLAADLIARNASANRVEHRLAVIGFGSVAAVEIPFTSQAEQLRARITALRHEDRGDTDVLAALVAAEQLFRTLRPDPDRRRALVLFTDGVPYVRGRDMNAYRAELQHFRETHFEKGGVSVDVLVRDAGTDGRLLPEAHGVIARLVGTRTAESAPAKSNPAVDALVVPPYLDMIVFDVFRGSGGAAVDVFPPGSPTPVRAGAGGVESMRIGDVLVTLAVPRPPPGEWTIRKSRGDARVRILSQQFFPRGILLQPEDAAAVRRCERVSLAYRITDGNGGTFQELPGYTLSLDVTLVEPGAGEAGIVMERDPARGSGVFVSGQDFVCERPGRYWTDVRVSTIDANGRRLDVFRDRWSGFSVDAGEDGDCRAVVTNMTSPGALSRPRRVPWFVPAFLAGAAGVAALLWWRKTNS